MKHKAIVMGGGLGGLAAALTLSKEYEVHIIEKNEMLGGKMHPIELDGFHFDFGPNTLTMPHIFNRVLSPFIDKKRLLDFKKIDKPTKHQLMGYEVIFSTDIDEMVEQLLKIDEESAMNYPKFIAEITRLYRIAEKSFLSKTFFKRKDYLSLQLGVNLLKTHPFQTLNQFLKGYFPSPVVQQLFERFATYIGSSPYETPATFALIAYFELVKGTYYVEGGATQIAKTFAEALKRQGVTIHLNELIQGFEVDKKKVIACQTNRAKYEANVFISNMDYDLTQQLLGREMPNEELSTSAYVECIGLTEAFPLNYHNVWFSEDYEAEFTALRVGEYAKMPTIYACYPYVLDPSHPPALFVLINAPHGEVDSQMQSLWVDVALRKWGIEEVHIAVREKYPPQFIQNTFLTRFGAIYGRASNTFRGSFFRPANRDFHLKNLYYVGGTVHPGGSSPIVVKGGYEVAKRILENK